MTHLYVLSHLGLGEAPRIEISTEHGEALLSARVGLFETLAIEEKYDFLCRAYIEFERSLNDIALSQVASAAWGWSDCVDHIQSVNYRLMNLLALCRMYVDHIPQHLNAIFGDKSQQATEFKAATSAEYDAHLGYRALYALRNYVQHSGLPVYSLTVGSSWSGQTETDSCKHYVTPVLSVEALSLERDFSKRVLNDLRAIGRRIDLKLLVRQNMSCFSRLHAYVRGMVASQNGSWDVEFSRAIEQYEQSSGLKQPGVVLIEVTLGDSVEVPFSVFADVSERRKRLEARNRCLVNVERHYVSSEVVP